jgi:hypothetical protein
MDKILYLVHSISTDYDKTWTELKTSSVDDINHQFPGVFFTFITKETLQRESLYYNKTILIFSKKLLEQENYHINLSDYNGFINEKNTYFPWQLDKAVKKYKSIFKKTNNHVGNEIVFHDPIPMKYLCAVIINKSISDEISDKYNMRMRINLLLPKYEIYNDEPPDMSKLPFYCMPLEDNFTGFNKYKLSSKKFYQKMAQLCNVNTDQTREKIIEEIKLKMIDIYYNRNKQNLKEFKKMKSI